MNSVRDAYAAGATRLVHGYFDRRGGELHFAFSIEDGATHKMVETLTLEGPVLDVAGRLARVVDPGARAFSSTDPEAVEAWGRREFERAVSIDPDFGAAWLGWVQSLIAAGRNDDALERATQALARSGLQSPIDRANLEVLHASLHGDEAARDEALLQLVRLLPNDAALAYSLAENALNGRRFAQAVQLFRQVTRIDPQNASAHNLLGYALTYAGDLPAARKAFDTYARYPGHEANALDSQGEALFISGQFAEAERYFLNAHEKDPNLLDGSDLLKAAYARWLSGDSRAADPLFERYLEFRSKQQDPSIAWRRAVWEYSTGRQAEAIRRLESEQGPGRQLAQRQLAVWNNPDALPRDLAQLDQVYGRTAPSLDGFIRVLYARALLQAGRTEEARELLRFYPLPESGDPLFQSFVYPLYRELLP